MSLACTLARSTVQISSGREAILVLPQFRVVGQVVPPRKYHLRVQEPDGHHDGDRGQSTVGDDPWPEAELNEAGRDGPRPAPPLLHLCAAGLLACFLTSHSRSVFLCSDNAHCFCGFGVVASSPTSFSENGGWGNTCFTKSQLRTVVQGNLCVAGLCSEVPFSRLDRLGSLISWASIAHLRQPRRCALMAEQSAQTLQWPSTHVALLVAPPAGALLAAVGHPGRRHEAARPWH